MISKNPPVFYCLKMKIHLNPLLTAESQNRAHRDHPDEPECGVNLTRVCHLTASSGVRSAGQSLLIRPIGPTALFMADCIFSASDASPFLHLLTRPGQVERIIIFTFIRVTPRGQVKSTQLCCVFFFFFSFSILSRPIVSPLGWGGVGKKPALSIILGCRDLTRTTPRRVSDRTPQIEVVPGGTFHDGVPPNSGL